MNAEYFFFSSSLEFSSKSGLQQYMALIAPCMYNVSISPKDKHILRPPEPLSVSESESPSYGLSALSSGHKKHLGE